MFLRCCEIETDRRGRVGAFETRDGEGCSSCGDERRAPIESAFGRPHRGPCRLIGKITVDDGLRERVEALIPPRPRRFRNFGHERLDSRRAMDGMLFVLRMGMAWRPCRRSLAPAP